VNAPEPYRALAGPNLAPATIEALDATAVEGQIDIGLIGDIYLRDDYLANFGVTNLGLLRNELWQSLANARLIVANLEAPITGQTVPLEAKPHLHKTSDAVLNIFDSRFVLCLANNHIMDYGVAGLVETLSALDAAGIPHAGAGLNLAQASAPARLNVDGTEIAVICAADPRFRPATGDTPGTFPARRDSLVKAIRATAGDGAVVVLSLHMGLEHVSVPSAAQIELAEACVEAGATVVHFHHSHCLAGAVVAGSCTSVLFGTGDYVYTKPARPESSKCTASWRVRIAVEPLSVIAIGADPAFIDERGLPKPLESAAAVPARAQIQALGEVPLSGWRRQRAQLRDMLRPGFLRMNARNYAAVMRKRGLFYLLRILMAGIRAQLGSTRR